ncbi:MAG: esterase-like activity of phytase family protein, partial [Acidobacteriota bacterium]|nr:esterase-like activity of phytase family protein [Acidobacteriota bacterium]
MASPSWVRAAAIVGAALTAMAGAAARAEEVAASEAIEWLGEAVIGRGPVGVEAPVGGLSGLAYDASGDRFFAISDDRSQHGPARIYELSVRLEGGRLADGGARATGVLELRGPGGAPYAYDTIDPESLARTPGGRWIVSSEGQARAGVPAALIEFGSDGRWLGELAIPRAFRPRERKGIRNNAALESVAISPDGRWLFSGTENALLQDGPPASAGEGSASRLLRFDLASRRLRATYLYRTEPLAAAPVGDELAINGLVDLLALDGERLLALERSFTAGRGNAIRLFLVDLRGASDVSGVRRLGRARGVTAA